MEKFTLDLLIGTLFRKFDDSSLVQQHRSEALCVIPSMLTRTGVMRIMFRLLWCVI